MWGLQQFGFRAIVAPSYGDIFRSNCFKNGVLAVELPRVAVERLVDLAGGTDVTEIRIDLREQTVVAGDVHETFTLERATRRSLLEGLDDVDLSSSRLMPSLATRRAGPAGSP